MIVFTLDALADDSHRRHLIGNLHWEFCQDPVGCHCGIKPDYPAYYEACNGDAPIIPVISMLRSLWSIHDYNVIEIWSDHPESNRNKIYEWTMKQGILKGPLKLRPNGNAQPQEELFEGWLTEYMKYPELPIASPENEGMVYRRNDLPEMVFSSHKPTIEMFRARGVFVFDCNQGG